MEKANISIRNRNNKIFYNILLHLDTPVLVDQQNLTFTTSEWKLDAVWKTYE